MEKKRRTSIFGITTALLVVGIVLLANVVSVNLFGRLDLTEGKIFSLNDASKKMAGSLDDNFLVKVYFSKDLPAPYNANAKYVQDKLDEYKAYGKGRFQYTFIDPADDAKLQEEAQKYRIPPVQVQVVEQDQFQSKKAYMGMVFLFRDRQEVMPVVENTAGLEYEITSNMKKLTSDSDELPVIGFLAGHGEPLMEELQTIQQVFDKQYRMRAVTVSDGSHVPNDISILVIASPRQPIPDWDRYAVDQFLMRGGKAGFLIDKVDVNLQFQQATPIRLGADGWFESYGFGIDDNLIADQKNPGLLTISQQEGFFRMMSQVPFPFIPALRDFNKSNIIVKDLERVSFYFVSSIDTSAARGKGLVAEPVIMTSANTMIQEDTYNINPLQKWAPEQFDRGQQVVAAVIHGSFTSAFKDKPVPTPSDTAAAKPPDLNAVRSDQSPETRIVVMGDGEFFADQKGGADRDNLLFFQNMIDWLAQDEALIAIRSREVTDRPLKTVSEPAKRFVKYANLFGSPAIVILLGIAIWQARRRRQIDI